MKKIILMLCVMFGLLSAAAQDRQGLYLYRTNGNIDVFYTDQVDSIYFSPQDLDGNTHPDMVTQCMKVGKYFWRIPLAEIDSISFVHPDPSAFCKEGKLNAITGEAFRTLVWDYKKHPDKLVFEGERPVVMDYWAPWCGYCIKMMPLLEQLAQEYKGKVDFYKVNTDDEIELSNVMGMTSLPCFYFYPKKGEPVIYMGAMDLASMRKIIEEVLLVVDDENPDAVKPEIALSCWKGDREQEWTDRKVTMKMSCLSKNAELVKMGCFLKEEFVNSGLTAREMVQNYGEVLAEDMLPQVNSGEGLTLSFPVKRSKEYLLICMMKNAQGGVAVEQVEVTTDEMYVPLLDFQAQCGALEELMEPGQKYISIFMKAQKAEAARYGCLTKVEYEQKLAAGETRQTILEKDGVALTADDLVSVNGRGFSVAIGGLLPETDYVCLASVTDAKGKVTTSMEEVYTPFDGYDDRIDYPEAGLVATLMGNVVSCSFNCPSGSAIYAALLMLPSAELSQLLAEGKTLEEIMDTHPSVSVCQEQQMEWVNGQGISNVYPSLMADTRYTWVVDMRGRFGGRSVKRCEVRMLPAGVAVNPIDVQLNASCVQGLLSASVTCLTGNATALTAVLLESETLEKKLASGLSLEQIMELPAEHFEAHEVLSDQQLEWVNQNGFILGHSFYKPHTRYTWVVDVRNKDGQRNVSRSEVLTPKARKS